MAPSTHYTRLLEEVHTIWDLYKIAAVLGWDQQVSMPKSGSEARADQLTTLNRIIHERFTADSLGELIALAGEEVAGEPYESDQAGLLRYLNHEYHEARKLPTDFVARRTTISNLAFTAWEAAREADDFASFEPWLTQIVELSQEMAGYYGYDSEPYDALLNRYELGATTVEVRRLFDAVREFLLPLREAIGRQPEIDDSCLSQYYPVDRQRAFAAYLTNAVGYDLERGHLGTATHPFATSFSRNDTRITARWYPDFLSPALFGTLHESGHALYEQNTHPDLARTFLARGTSSGIHESQSRLIENIVGRSYGFWQRHFGQLREYFPEQLAGVTVDDFYRAINKVQPSLIRVEADEVTYNLHIILRFELEQAMLNGELAAQDLPEAWREKMEAYLGIVPANDQEGCLQDIHWSSPSFGYFPTYALGNLYAAQFFEAAQEQMPVITAELAQGRTESLVQWLRKQIHQHGRKFTAGELIQKTTGRPLSHEPFTRYITDKFRQIYSL